MPRHDPSGAGEPPRPARRPLLIGLATLLVLAAAGCGLDNTGDQAAAPSTSASRAVPATPSASPTCLPRVVETGFSQTLHYYGVVVENPCPQAAINIVSELAVFDDHDKRLDGYLPPPEISVILPGQRLGFGGLFQLKTTTRVSRVQVSITDAEAAPVTDFAAWAKSTAVDDPAYSAPDRNGITTISGRIRTDPPAAKLCQPWVNLILRDGLGHIIYGDTRPVRGTDIAFDVVLPKDIDRSRTEFFVTQGRGSVGLWSHGPDAACAVNW